MTKPILKGTMVSFTDKYGQHLTGEFIELRTVPHGTGEAERAIVRAFPFGDDLPVECVVPVEKLSLA
jgi:hypothetical protein